MAKNKSFNMRIIHRYLGFFLAGIMAMYALSGIILVFRKTDTFKKEVKVEKQLETRIIAEDLGKVLDLENLKVTKQDSNILYFDTGSYDQNTGIAIYTIKELPFVLKKMTNLHKATTNDPLYWLNIFFGASLFFFVISSFWMFLPSTQVFKKGVYFTLAGIVLTLVLLFV